MRSYNQSGGKSVDAKTVEGHAEQGHDTHWAGEGKGVYFSPTTSSGTTSSAVNQAPSRGWSPPPEPKCPYPRCWPGGGPGGAEYGPAGPGGGVGAEAYAL